MNCPNCGETLVYDRQVARFPKDKPVYFLDRWKCSKCKAEVTLPRDNK